MAILKKRRNTVEYCVRLVTIREKVWNLELERTRLLQEMRTAGILHPSRSGRQHK